MATQSAFVIVLFVIASFFTPILTAAERCELTVGLWTREFPLFYFRDQKQMGIFPDLLQQVSADIKCQLTLRYLPASRSQPTARKQHIDIALYAAPVDSDLHPLQPKYIRGMKQNVVSDVTDSPQVIISYQPILVMRAGYIARKGSSDPFRQNVIIAADRIGSLRMEHHTAAYWREFLGIPFVPKGFGDSLQGLRALAAKRIDFFVYFSVGLQQFEQQHPGSQLELVKEVTPVAVRPIIFTERSQQDARSMANHLEQSIARLWQSGTVKSVVQRHSRLDYFHWPNEDRITLQ
jgi:ABC-type amino acid transport substrate-binding protein